MKFGKIRPKCSYTDLTDSINSIADINSISYLGSGKYRLLSEHTFANEP